MGARLTEGPGRPPSGRSCEPGGAANDEMPDDPRGPPSRPWAPCKPGGPLTSTVGPWAEHGRPATRGIKAPARIRARKALLAGFMPRATPRDADTECGPHQTEGE